MLCPALGGHGPTFVKPLILDSGLLIQLCAVASLMLRTAKSVTKASSLWLVVLIIFRIIPKGIVVTIRRTRQLRLPLCGQTCDPPSVDLPGGYFFFFCLTSSRVVVVLVWPRRKRSWWSHIIPPGTHHGNDSTIIISRQKNQDRLIIHSRKRGFTTRSYVPTSSVCKGGVSAISN